MAGGERPWTWILCSETVMISMHRGGLEDTVKTGRFGFLLIPCSLHEMPKFPYTVCRKSADWLPLVLPGILTQKKAVYMLQQHLCAIIQIHFHPILSAFPRKVHSGPPRSTLVRVDSHWGSTASGSRAYKSCACPHR
jgi:hypothetical protein